MPLLQQEISILLNDFECAVQLAAIEDAPRASYFDVWLKPHFGVIPVILRAFAHMYTRSVFMKRVVTVKPENQEPLYEYSWTLANFPWVRDIDYSVCGH